jgi:hypothetical protein
LFASTEYSLSILGLSLIPAGVWTLTFVFTFDEINNCIGCGNGFSDGEATTAGKATIYRVPSVRFSLLLEFCELAPTTVNRASKRGRSFFIGLPSSYVKK